uniref:Uncharacterized protein n=1 Tax=Desertifilum tharense IPPAS B-1220 TaxID=1781255 RepID=A0ACD5H225_9CYAN
MLTEFQTSFFYSARRYLVCKLQHFLLSIHFSQHTATHQEPCNSTYHEALLSSHLPTFFPTQHSALSTQHSLPPNS